MFEFSVVDYAPGQYVPHHEHERAGAFAVLRGAYGEHAAGGWRHLTPGDFLARAPGHEHTNAFAVPCRVLLAMIDNEALESGWALAPRFDRTGTSRTRCCPEAMTAVAAQVAEPTPIGLLEAEDRMLEALRLASREPSHSGGRLAQRPPHWLTGLVERLHEEETPESIASLAATCQVNPSHLTRAFRRWRGCSVSEYLRRLRIQQAAAALRESDLPLSTIAHQTGFFDQAHLTRRFKAIFRDTPAAYRRTFRASRARRIQD